MGKVIAREFIWLVVALIMSLPLAAVFLWFFGYTLETINMNETTKDSVFWLYIAGYFGSFINIYIVRFVMLAIKALGEDEEEA